MMILVEGEVDQTRRRMNRGPRLHNNHKPQPLLEQAWVYDCYATTAHGPAVNE